MSTQIKSGHKTFDRKTDVIATGNVMARTMYGAFIRPRSETRCNGKTFPPGALQDFDLDHAIFDGIPREVEAAVRAAGEAGGTQVILHRFFHRRGGRRIDHVWAITRPDDTLVRSFVTGPTRKSRAAVLAACEIVAPPRSAHERADRERNAGVQAA